MDASEAAAALKQARQIVIQARQIVNSPAPVELEVDDALGRQADEAIAAFEAQAHRPAPATPAAPASKTTTPSNQPLRIRSVTLQDRFEAKAWGKRHGVEGSVNDAVARGDVEVSYE